MLQDANDTSTHRRNIHRQTDDTQQISPKYIILKAAVTYVLRRGGEGLIIGVNNF